jgi:all-trans-retinol 13,14-reductase
MSQTSDGSFDAIVIGSEGPHFPALAPLIVHREVSTPLSTASFTGAPQGCVYGLEASPRRFLSKSLRAKTPVPGLYLAGQDVTSLGITGAMMGGVLAAAAVEPRLFRHVPSSSRRTGSPGYTGPDR